MSCAYKPLYRVCRSDGACVLSRSAVTARVGDLYAGGVSSGGWHVRVVDRERIAFAPCTSSWLFNEPCRLVVFSEGVSCGEGARRSAVSRVVGSGGRHSGSSAQRHYFGL